MREPDGEHTPITYDTCARVTGPFFHGTKASLVAGAELVAGYESNFQGASYGWQRFFGGLERVLAGLD